MRCRMNMHLSEKSGFITLKTSQKSLHEPLGVTGLVSELNNVPNQDLYSSLYLLSNYLHSLILAAKSFIDYKFESTIRVVTSALT